MAGPVPAIHVFAAAKAWIPATSAGMTSHPSATISLHNKKKPAELAGFP
jgi:hypothetical protein